MLVVNAAADLFVFEGEMFCTDLSDLTDRLLPRNEYAFGGTFGFGMYVAALRALQAVLPRERLQLLLGFCRNDHGKCAFRSKKFGAYGYQFAKR